MDYYLEQGKDGLATRTEGRSIGGIVGSFEHALEGAEVVRDQERIVGQQEMRDFIVAGRVEKSIPSG
ncbi:hypothetical protein IPU70_15800 [Achromobacter sp. SD115]|uniref:hypothetical protein n=1 Tax=Achromobacter sp. SD115 TaxID=2782011 RepID=UPI001A97BD92|nr:hypothetical protein [Achromobacter sp. SD115]MBO1015025.1 hypothetical protein [Achromobacter sp. SD115]